VSEAVTKAVNCVTGLDLQARGKKIIPGLTQLLSKRPDQFAPGVWPGYYQKANGAEVWDLDGNRFLDMSIAGIGATVLGYADPDVDAAVTHAITNGVACSLNCREDVELAELLLDIHGWAEMVRYSRTGGEAMAMAVRLARATTGRDKIAFCGYHGWHDWYLAANLGTENALGEHLLPGLDPRGVPRGLEGTALPFRYNHLDDLQAIVDEHGEDLAAIITEPVRSEWPQDDFLPGVRAMADRCGAVFVIDEISAAFRMNSGGAHLMFGIEPDLAVFSKSIGNGYAMAAVIGRRPVMEVCQSTFISSTNWTERIGPSAALATISKHRRLDAGKHLVAIGEKIQHGWKALAEKHRLPIHVSGIPPLSHFVFECDQAMTMKALFVQNMLDRGILASTLFYSMLAHTDEHVVRYLEAADQAFAEVSAASTEGNLAARLRGEPAVAGFKRLA
jgi:glutamate-1-semialdehyde 2,1-aminomutase